jgi:hypothetical protein
MPAKQPININFNAEVVGNKLFTRGANQVISISPTPAQRQLYTYHMPRGSYGFKPLRMDPRFRESQGFAK